jgi:hypothetical protein
VLRLPFVLHPYQVDFITRLYSQRATILSAGTGLGKTVMSISAAEMLVEDGVIDHVVVAAESSKVSEWVLDIESYTGRQALTWRGPKRTNHLGDLPVYLVGTYETLRGDFAVKLGSAKNKRGWSWADGDLLTALLGRRVLLLRDEGAAKMGATRSSWLYQAFKRFGERMKQGHPEGFRVVEISATPMNRDPEGFYNLGALIAPERVGNVGYFDETYVDARDLYSHKPTRFKNLSPPTPAGVIPLSELLAPIMLVKSKTDPDVVALFPEMPDTDYATITLSEAEATLYHDVVQRYAPSGRDRELFTMMRQLVGHPASLTRSQGALAQLVTEEMGSRLLKVGTTKLDALVTRCQALHRQGAQSVCFTFFGQSLLPLIAERLREEGLSVVTNHGGSSPTERDHARNAFRAGDAEIFLSSDAGARGINLEAGEYVDQFDLPLLDSISYQRLSRISRLSSTHSVVFSHAWVVTGTIESHTLDILLRRKEWVEEVVGSAGLSAEQIRKIIKAESERVS